MPATATPQRFTERTAGAPVRIDREQGIVYGVRVCGHDSRNRRRYPPSTLEAARPLYENARVYVDHPRRSERDDDRRFAEWVGVLKNVRAASDGLRGDLHLRRQSGHFESILEAAEKFPKSFGMSHAVDARSHRDGDVVVVDEIFEVISVDIVTDPASTAGLFESKQRVELLSPMAKSVLDTHFRNEKRLRDYERRFRQRGAALRENRNPSRRRFTEMLPGATPLSEPDFPGEPGLMPRGSAAVDVNRLARDGVQRAIAIKLQDATDEQLRRVIDILGIVPLSPSTTESYRQRFLARAAELRENRSRRRR